MLDATYGYALGGKFLREGNNLVANGSTIVEMTETPAGKAGSGQIGMKKSYAVYIVTGDEQRESIGVATNDPDLKQLVAQAFGKTEMGDTVEGGVPRPGDPNPPKKAVAPRPHAIDMNMARYKALDHYLHCDIAPFEELKAMSLTELMKYVTKNCVGVFEGHSYGDIMDYVNDLAILLVEVSNGR